MYVTPTRYRAMGLGVDLTGIDDATLGRILTRASAQVDAYCSAPRIPSRYDFRGGTQTAEQHSWSLGDEWRPLGAGARRIYPYSTPIKAITGFAIKFTNTYQVTIDPANLYVDRISGWAEVVSLAALVTGVYPVGINFGLYSPVAEVSYTYGYNLSTTEILTADELTKTFTGSSQWWTGTPVISKNGTHITTGFTIDLDEGAVTFSTPLTAEDVVLAAYDHRLPQEIAEATALIATDALGERDLVARGMSGLARLSVEEVTLQRSVPRGVQTITMEVRPEVALLLENWIFRTVR